MRNEGITILQIVITIIIMLILAVIAVFYGVGVPREARIMSIYNEMRVVENALTEAQLLNKIHVSNDETHLTLFDEISVERINKSDYSETLSVPNGDISSDNCYLLNFSKSRKLGNILETENVQNDYILDYDNMNVYLVKGVEISEKVGNAESMKTLYNSDDIETYYKDTFSSSN